jgi:hypothetical protein
MSTKKRRLFVGLLVLATALSTALAAGQGPGSRSEAARGRSNPVGCSSNEQGPGRHWRTTFSDRFFPRDCAFHSTGSNAFFVLEPGYQLVFEAGEDDELVRLVITILDETEVVDGVATRVVEERESVGGVIAEVARNFMALCAQTGDLYYFGEDVDNYENGEIANHDGTWRAGVAGARAGVLLPGSPIVGARYYQEFAPRVALDRAEIIGFVERFEVEAGTFEDVLFVFETNALEPTDASYKYYAPGIGLVKDDDLELVDYGFDVE